MDDKELDELLDGWREEEDNINEIQKIIKNDERRRIVNARYYQKNKQKIELQNAQPVRCKLCNKSFHKGSYQLHKKSKLHKRLLELSKDLIDDSDDDN